MLINNVIIRFCHLHKGTYIFELDEEAKSSLVVNPHNPPGKKKIELEVVEALPVIIDVPGLGMRMVVKSDGMEMGLIPGVSISF